MLGTQKSILRLSWKLILTWQFHQIRPGSISIRMFDFFYFFLPWKLWIFKSAKINLCLFSGIKFRRFFFFVDWKSAGWPGLSLRWGQLGLAGWAGAGELSSGWIILSDLSRRVVENVQQNMRLWLNHRFFNNSFFHWKKDTKIINKHLNNNNMQLFHNFNLEKSKIYTMFWQSSLLKLCFLCLPSQ